MVEEDFFQSITSCCLCHVSNAKCERRIALSTDDDGTMMFICVFPLRKETCPVLLLHVSCTANVVPR